MAAQMRQMLEESKSLQEEGRGLGEWLRSFQVDLGNLVEIELDESGVPVSVRFTREAQGATPEQIEAATSRAVVEGFMERRGITPDPQGTQELLLGLMGGGLPEPQTVAGPDRRVSIDVLAGRPVRLRFAEGFVANRRLDEVAQSVLDTCTAVLTSSGETREY